MAHAMPADVAAQIREKPGNNKCVDCGANGPQWASVSYGVLMCLECSGQHRSLGVHLSFVRSVSMDSWSDKQIKMMQLGGNAALIKFFKEHGVNEMGIRDKYNTPAAELYRERMLALRDDRDPPTSLSSPSTRPAAVGMSSPAGIPSSGMGSSSPMGTPGSGGGGGAESPYEREMRLRREAEARLREKFGAGGLKGQSVSNSGGFGYTPGEDDGGSSPHDIKHVAGEALSKLSSVFVKGAKEISKKLADPDLATKVNDKASSLFQSAAAGATGLWSRATAALEGRPSSSSAHHMSSFGGRPSGYSGVGGGGGSLFDDGSEAPHRSSSSGGPSSSKAQPSSTRGAATSTASKSGGSSGWDDDWEDSHAAQPPARIKLSKAGSGGATTSAPGSAADDDDFGEWSSFSVSGNASAPAAAATSASSTSSSASASIAKTTSSGGVGGSASNSPSATPTAGMGTPGKLGGGGGLSTPTPLGSGNVTPTTGGGGVSKPKPTAAAVPVAKPDDFFASFGVVTSK